MSFAPLKLSRQLKRELPAWYHLGAPPRAYHKSKDDCLQRTHKANKVKNLIKMSNRLRHRDETHHPRRNCACQPCHVDREKGCVNPHKCAQTAKDLLERLAPLYNPSSNPPNDDLTLTHHRLEKNQRAIIHRGDEIVLNPSVTTHSLSNCFRIFAPPMPKDPTPLHRPLLIAPPPTQLTVFTDGSCLQNGTDNARSGGGVWFADDHPLNRAIRVPGLAQSNQVGELAAVVVALKSAPRNADLTIVTDSQYVIRCLTDSLPQWEDSGWPRVPNAPWIKAAAYAMRRRSAPTRFKWVKGHNSNRGNERADALAAEGAAKPTPDDIDISVPPLSEPGGMKLNKLTQAVAYKLIRSLNCPPESHRSKVLLDCTRSALESLNDGPPRDENIWRNVRHPDIRRPIQTFLLRALHGSLKIGDFWERIQNYEQHAQCSVCNETTESLDHILLECPQGHANLIWTNAKSTWPACFGAWPAIHLGTILGCGSLSLPALHQNGHPNPGRSRLLRILLSESAHLIWVLRCERVIQGTNHSVNAIINRWTNKINHRLTLDRFIATKWNRKPITQKLVENTWTPSLLQTTPDLPQDWITNSEVLVGIKPSRPPAYRGPRAVHGAPHYPTH